MHPRIAIQLISIGLLVAGPLANSAGAADNERLALKFGVYTSDKPTVMFRKFKPVLKAIERHLRTEVTESAQVKLQIYDDYDSAIRALVKGEVDFVRFGPASYVIAKDQNPGVQLIAVEENKGKRRFSGVIFTRDSSPIRSIADLKGHSFAFGDENSTIGRYLSQALLVENDIRASDLSSYKYLGRHDRVATAVANERFDAGAAKVGTFKKYKDRGLREIARFENVTKPWIARSGLDASVLTALRESLLTLADKETLKSVSKNLSGFGTVTDNEYEFVRQGMKASKEFLNAVAARDSEQARTSDARNPEAAAP